MRIMTAAMIAFAVSFSGAAPGEAAGSIQCSDRNALNGISVDARLVAIKYYFAGLVRGSTDPARQACYEAHALGNEGTAILNKTLQIIETNCSTMEGAARAAIEPACP
jgi:hypothetical protein